MRIDWGRAYRFGMTAVLSAMLVSACVGPTDTPTTVPPGITPLPGTPGPLPDLKDKPTPVEITFNGCPPEGNGGDPLLNRLKNRVDEGNYYPVLFDAIMQLTWPKTIERRHRANWPAADTAAISRYEGIPVAVEGYLAGAKESGAESTNCDGGDLASHDYHVWLTKSAGEDRTNSIVVEPTPRTRVNHPGWRVDVLNRIAREGLHVRISGWTMLDPEHPDEIGKTRGTLWEIHPVMQIEVEQQGKWVTLDEFAAQP